MNAHGPWHDGFASALLDPARQFAGMHGESRGTTGFAVHRNNVMVALLDALADAFPVTRAVVGEAFFNTMARDYVRADPPRSPVMATYGAGFADFIAVYPAAAGVAWLADLARLERLRNEAFHAADAVPMASARWTRLLDDSARLGQTRVGLQPACRWLSSKHPVLSIWQAHQQSDAARDAALACLDLQVGEDLLVHRPRWDVQLAALPPGGIAWLEALRAGECLGEAMQRARAAAPHASPPQLFALLLQHGLVTAAKSTASGESPLSSKDH